VKGFCPIPQHDTIRIMMFGWLKLEHSMKGKIKMINLFLLSPFTLEGT
jgi:hypothetical protein